METPNIFNYASKELSQDAVMAWFFACLHSNNTNYKTIGKQFIAFIFDQTYMVGDIQSDMQLESTSPHTQYHKIDVYSVLKIGNIIHPIIIEDKTNTFLHDEQMMKYCKTVAKWTKEKKYLNELKTGFDNKDLNWGDILYVYFKSGFSPNFEKKLLKVEAATAKAVVKETNSNINLQVREIYLDDMINFIASLKCDYKMIADYLSYLVERKKWFDESYSNALTETSNKTYEQYFSNTAGCSKLFEQAFGENKEFNDHLYQGWASMDIFKMPSTLENCNENDIVYCFRFQKGSQKDSSNSKKSHSAYAFQLQQYRNEKKVKGNSNNLLNEKRKQAKHIQNLCNDLCKEIKYSMDHIIDFEITDLDKAKGTDGKMLMKVFIYGNNTPNAVSKFIHKFTNRICKEVKAEAKEVYF